MSGTTCAEFQAAAQQNPTPCMPSSCASSPAASSSGARRTWTSRGRPRPVRTQDRPVGMTVKGRTVEWASFKDLALHCRRTTRPPEKIQRLIKDLLEVYSGQQDRDLLGTLLLDVDRGRDMWDSQKRHAVCIEDPPGVTLYTKTGTLKKGTVVLPTFRCARGSSSLKPSHLHLSRFISGK